MRNPVRPLLVRIVQHWLQADLGRLKAPIDGRIDDGEVSADAYIRAAREEGNRRGLAARVSYHHGDFLELAETIPPADIVTLDRVINVYPDWKRLIQVSASRARRRYGLVYPRNTPPVRVVVSLMNLLVWRGPGHASVHSPEVIGKLACDTGIVRCFSKTTGPWEVALYRRH